MTANIPETTHLEAASFAAENFAVAGAKNRVSRAADVVVSTEKLEGQQRRILAFTDIPATADQVWQVLTDYDNLASFIPNLSCSKRLSHPGGGTRLEQMGSQCFLNIKFCARVVLDMVEVFPRELRFSMVEGDFRQFEGRWTLEPVAKAQGNTVRLTYELVIRPPRAMPVALIERHICNDLSRNLDAISDRTVLLFSA